MIINVLKESLYKTGANEYSQTSKDKLQATTIYDTLVKI